MNIIYLYILLGQECIPETKRKHETQHHKTVNPKISHSELPKIKIPKNRNPIPVSRVACL
jgi:hypothetical protein